MAGTIKVRVMYDNYGTMKPRTGAAVALGYAGGVSSRKYTSSSGYVTFDALGYWGSVTVYVDGCEIGRYSCQGGADITVNKSP